MHLLWLDSGISYISSFSIPVATQKLLHPGEEIILYGMCLIEDIDWALSIYFVLEKNYIAFIVREGR